MELPNYFLADLPNVSALTPKLIAEACDTLKRNRERFLLPRSTDSIIRSLSSLAKEWLDVENPIRKYVLANSVAQTGFSSATLSKGLTAFFSQITRENLEHLILQDLGTLQRLDQIVSDNHELKSNRSSIAHGPGLIVHFTGGVIPNPALMSMILGLLTKSAQFVKCASGAAFIARMFAHSLYQAEPKLGSCLEMADWKGGNDLLESALVETATCLTVTGSDETISKIHPRIRPGTRVLEYGHKLSFAFVTREMVSRIHLSTVVHSLCDDIVAWDQLGCLSPHVVYVETGGDTGPHLLGEEVARELATREKAEPRGPVSAETSAAITSRRMLYEVRASASENTKLWQSEGSTAWTVVYEDDPRWQSSCLNRFVYIKAVSNLTQLSHSIDPIQSHISTVGVSVQPERARAIASELATIGAKRICPIGQMQNPPLTWRHDGRPTLGDLVTWSDIEL